MEKDFNLPTGTIPIDQFNGLLKRGDAAIGQQTPTYRFRIGRCANLGGNKAGRSNLAASAQHNWLDPNLLGNGSRFFSFSCDHIERDSPQVVRLLQRYPITFPLRAVCGHVGREPTNRPGCPALAHVSSKPKYRPHDPQYRPRALSEQGEFRPLDVRKNVALITLEVRAHTEIDEVALGRNKEARSTMLPALLAAGLDVREYALAAQAHEHDVDEAIAFAKGAQQIVLQTYNAMLVPGQQRLIAALPQEKLWLVAGRMPYDLDLAPEAQGRLASYGCRPAALLPVVEKLLGGEA